MKNKLRLIIAAMLLCFVVPLSVSASEAASGTYQNVMSTSLSKFFIKSQPNDAIPLDTVLVLDNTDLGKAENGIYFNLPRLKNQYYYKVSGETNWYIDERSPYPSLSLKDGTLSVAETKVNVQIFSAMTGTIQANCELTILDQMRGTERFSWPSYQTIKDGVTAGNAKMITAPTHYLNAYNPALHKSAVVTQGSVYVFDTAFNDWVNQSVSYDASTGTINDLTGEIMDINTWINADAIKDVTYTSYGLDAGNVDLHVLPYCVDSEGAAFITDSSSYNAVTGLLSSGASAEASYALVNDDSILFHEYDPGVSLSGPEGVNFTMQQGYSYTFNEITNGHLAQIPTEYFQFYPNTGKYTAKTGDSFTIPLYAPGPTLLNFAVTVNGSGGGTEVNPPPNDPTTYTLRFDYTGGLSKAYQDITPGVDPALPTPTKSGYTFVGWYVDSALTKQYDYRTYNYVLGASYTVYAKFEAIGNYTVRYYDDKNNTDKSETYRVGEQPSLPPNPTYTGYIFKQWVIVDNTAATSGTRYDPSTFSPSNGDSYIFKALWDVQGVILSITPTQTEYWVGDEVDKTKLSVLVQTDSNGTTKNLSVGEFSVSPNTISKVGNNTITVRYDATGATGTVNLTGKSDYITGISAAYKGEDLTVGDVIPTGSITCKLTYKSGKVVETNEFSITPSSVKAAGTNTITVTASGYSTSITVNGKKQLTTPPNGSKPTTLSSITASYTGPQLYVGDNINAGDIKVTARYSDGSNSLVSSTLFNFSPSFIRNAGTNTITVSYQDKTCNLNIVGTEKSSLNNGSGSSVRPSTPTNDTGVSNTGLNGVANTGNGTNGTGGYAVKGSDDKGTSIGYLNGKNILDSLGHTSATVPYNEVDILREISEAGKGAESIDITLINTAQGNELTPEMVEALIDKGLTLNVTMVSPSDKSTRVGYWSFNGNSIDEIEYPIDLNLSFSAVDKEAETMYHISVYNFPYTTGTTLKVTMRDAYVAGTFVNMYTCDENLQNSKYISNMLWSAASEVDLPITDSYDFVLTDYVEKYTDGSDLTVEPVKEIPEVPVDDSDVGETSEEEEFDWGDDEPVTETKTKTGSVPLLPVTVGLIFVLVACAIIFTVLRVIRARADGYDPDDDLDDIPDYESDDDEEVDSDEPLDFDEEDE